MFNFHIFLILTILGLLGKNADATVATCYTGTGAGTSGQTCTSPNNAFCKTTFSGATVTKSCAETCTADTTTTCCTTDNCNSATPIAQCYTGTGAGAIGACATTDFTCKTTFSGAIVTKSCAATCTADSTTTCCSTTNCNTATPIAQCYVGTGSGTATSCATTDYFCKTAVANSVVTKSCAATCTADTATLCYSTTNGNLPTPVISCYSGTVTSGSGSTTSCAIANVYCQTSFSVTSNSNTKSCATTCTEGYASSVWTTCCSTQNCNTKTFISNNAGWIYPNSHFLLISLILGYFMKY